MVYVLDEYKFLHQAQRREYSFSLLLLKGEYDDELEWPISLDYELKVWLDRPRQIVETVQYGDINSPILEFCLFDPRPLTHYFLSRVTCMSGNKELVEITLPQELLELGWSLLDFNLGLIKEVVLMLIHVVCLHHGSAFIVVVRFLVSPFVNVLSVDINSCDINKYCYKCKIEGGSTKKSAQTRMVGIVTYHDGTSLHLPSRYSRCSTILINA